MKKESQEDLEDTPEKNFMKIKKTRDKYDMNDPQQRMLFYLNILKDFGALKRPTRKSPKKNKTENFTEKKA